MAFIRRCADGKKGQHKIVRACPVMQQGCLLLKAH